MRAGPRRASSYGIAAALSALAHLAIFAAIILGFKRLAPPPEKVVQAVIVRPSPLETRPSPSDRALERRPSRPNSAALDRPQAADRAAAPSSSPQDDEALRTAPFQTAPNPGSSRLTLGPGCLELRADLSDAARERCRDAARKAPKQAQFDMEPQRRAAVNGDASREPFLARTPKNGCVIGVRPKRGGATGDENTMTGSMGCAWSF